MTDAERKKIQKEIDGLTAKLRWEHLGAGVLETYRIRIEALRERLAGSTSVSG